MWSGRSLRTRKNRSQDNLYGYNNALNCRENGQPILGEKQPGFPSSWTSSMKEKLVGKQPKKNESTKIWLHI